MNQDDFQSHLATIDAGNIAHHALFKRAAAIWYLAQAVLKEYESRFEEAGLNEDQLNSLCENTIFAYSDRRPSSISLDGATQTITLTLKQLYGERDSDPIDLPYAWMTMADAELIAHFRWVLDGWLKRAQDKRVEKEREEETDRRAQYEALKKEFGQ